MKLEIVPVEGIPEVAPGDDLAGLLATGIDRSDIRPQNGDVVVVTHKVVSKAENRIVPDTDPPERLVEEEAIEVLRRRGSLVIARTRHGFVCANAGVDRSNVPAGQAVLLPYDPDRSAHRLRTRLEQRYEIRLGVVISDTFGRAWRVGQTDVAIGVSGIPACLDLRESTDAGGRTLVATQPAVADEIAGAADLVMGKSRGIPAAVVRGSGLVPGEGRATDLVRDPNEDLFL